LVARTRQGFDWLIGLAELLHALIKRPYVLIGRDLSLN